MPHAADTAPADAAQPSDSERVAQIVAGAVLMPHWGVGHYATSLRHDIENDRQYVARKTATLDAKAAAVARILAWEAASGSPREAMQRIALDMLCDPDRRDGAGQRNTMRFVALCEMVAPLLSATA